MASTEPRGSRSPMGTKPGGRAKPPGAEKAAAKKPAPRKAVAVNATASAVLEIDLDAVAANWQKLAERVGPATRCAAVVKADAYGLGMAQIVPPLARAGCKTFFVATLDEGLALRKLLP